MLLTQVHSSRSMRETPMRTANTAAGVAGPLRGPNGPLNGNIITRDAIGRASSQSTLYAAS